MGDIFSDLTLFLLRGLQQCEASQGRNYHDAAKMKVLDFANFKK
jgi:hypothetical protein